MTRPDKTAVLLIDDDEEDYLIVKRILSRISETPFLLEWTGDPEAGESIIAENRHDIYLIDYRLGETDGVELLKRFDLFMLEQPFILLTGIRNHDIERAATEIGISDYLVKGSFDEQLLERVLRYNMQRKKSEVGRMHQLKEMNDAKDEFIALASHQLRTPATAVKQYLGILIEGYAGELSDKQTQFLKIANESNDRELMIINDLLKTARLDAKRYKLNKRPHRLNAFVTDVIKDFDSILASKSQTIAFEPTDDIEVKLDKHEMKLALTNLIENAHKYSTDGSMITVSTKIEDDAVLICVHDEGVGIDSKDTSAIFEKFTRIPNALSDVTSGNGLGLYWVKRIIELHGGTVLVDSIPGKGTDFVLKLPR